MNLAFYWSDSFRRQLERLSESHDLVVAHLIRVGQYVDAIQAPAILEMTDALSERYNGLSPSLDLSLLQWAYLLDSGRVSRVERTLTQKFESTVVVSRKDKAAVEADHFGGRIEVVGNGVDTNEFGYVGPGSEPAALFIGKLTSEANIAACQRFAEEVLPLIRENIPTFGLRVVGHVSGKARRRLGRIPAVRLLGFQEEIQSVADGCLCGVCYMRYGGGVQNKVLNYMSMGLPAVVTPTAAEGISATNGVHWFVETTARSFADRIVDLYNSPMRGYKVGQSARRLIRNNYTWDGQLKKYREIVASLIDSSAAANP